MEFKKDSVYTNPWALDYKVRYYQCDLAETLSPYYLCVFLQEAAGEHAEHLGFAITHLIKRNLTWVLVKLRVSVKRMPRWRETVTVRTWPSGLDRLYAHRDFSITAAGSEEPLAAATTTWIMLDFQKRVPVKAVSRMGDIYRALYDAEPSPSMEYSCKKLPPPAAPDCEKKLVPRLSDIDLNGHITNTAYVDMVLESIPLDFLSRNVLSDLEIEYRNECFYGDDIVSASQGTAIEEAVPVQDGAGGAFLHTLRREKDGKEIANARTVWVPLGARPARVPVSD